MKVVNVRRQKCTHYIGRIGSYNISQHGEFAGLGNPFHIGPAADRDAAIQHFERWARKNPDVMSAIRNLPSDAVLGCWCKPLPCHGDVIVKLWNELNEEERR